MSRRRIHVYWFQNPEPAPRKKRNENGYVEELRVIKQRLKCIRHPGANRWCYVRPNNPDEHIALGLEEIMLWARKIVSLATIYMICLFITLKLSSTITKQTSTAPSPRTALPLTPFMNVSHTPSVILKPRRRKSHLFTSISLAMPLATVAATIYRSPTPMLAP